MLHLAGCKDNHFATTSQTFLEKSHLFMRESAGARVVRALCAWYAGALRTRASAGMPLKRKTSARQRARPSGAQKRGACPARGLRARRCVDGRG